MDTLEFLLARARELGAKVEYPMPPDRRMVNATSLNVRSGPSTAKPVVGSLKLGEMVTVLEELGNWARIGEGRWVYAGYLE